MNDHVSDWFAGLATIGGLLYFMAGFLCCYTIHMLRARKNRERVRVPWHLAGIVIGTAAIVVTSVQASTAYSTAEATAVRVQDCFNSFLAESQARAQIFEENDALSREERTLLFNYNRVQDRMWFDLLNPPGNLASMETSSPQRQKYGLEVVRKAIVEARRIGTRIDQIEDRQAALAEERLRHPPPSPTCGS